LTNLSRQIGAVADYLAQRGKRLNEAALHTLAETFRRQLRYRQLIQQQDNTDPRGGNRKDAA
jgi:hypothetical protein